MNNTITLDPNDPFDAALIPIVETNRRKRLDYAKDGDPFSNFKETSALLSLDGFGPVEAALFNCLQKIIRLRSLRANGRMNDAANETVDDTYLDLAVYAVILYGLSREALDDSAGKHRAPERPDPTVVPTIWPPNAWPSVPTPPWAITCCNTSQIADEATP